MLAIDDMDKEAVVVKHLNQSHAEQVAYLHQQSLVGDVLPALGSQFLVGYYRHVIANRTQVVLGAASGDKLVGFCQISLAPISLYKVIKSIPRSILQLIRLGFSSPEQLLRGLLAAGMHPKQIPNTAEITFIAVLPEFQGRGIGREMLRSAGDLVLHKGCTKLTTKTSNVIARDMYEKTFSAKTVSTSKLLGKRYWHLAWEVRNVDKRRK